MKSNKGKGLLGLIVLIIAIAVFGYMGYSHMNEIKLGLDLDGGVSITYQAVKENPTAEEMSDTIYKLQQRVEGYSNEAQVYQEGDNRINVDIPGVSDANAILEELGKPGSLYFMDMEGNVILTGAPAQFLFPGTAAADSRNSAAAVLYPAVSRDQRTDFFPCHGQAEIRTDRRRNPRLPDHRHYVFHYVPYAA